MDNDDHDSLQLLSFFIYDIIKSADIIKILTKRIIMMINPQHPKVVLVSHKYLWKYDALRLKI
ncbi:12900_t:CDS:2 [Funneliformis geosporum]|nr:12900_t:CDS:2 [Funneliformis geosporum]